jgi:hypothetical protein
MVCDQMSAHIGDMEDENEYMLSEQHADTLRSFVMGAAFDPFLEALDPDTERVEKRRQQVEDMSTFKALRRDRGLRDLHRWLQPVDDAVEYDADRYQGVPYAKAPEKASRWLDLIHTTTHLDDSQDVAGCISKALLNVMSYVHNMNWKVDYLLSQSRLLSYTPVSDNPFEDFLLKHPYLSRCDDHVAKVRNATPLQLSRTSAVSGCVSFVFG